MTLEIIFLLIAVGLVAGFAGGLFGIGGGVVIVPALYSSFNRAGVEDTLAIKLAIGTSMATIIVTSIRSVMRHHQHGNVEWSVLRSWAPALAVGAVMGAVAARYIDGRVLIGVFGAGLVLLALQRIMTAGRKAAVPSGQLPGTTQQYGMAAGTGMVSSLLGIGGGVIGVLLLTNAGRTVHRAVGTAAGFGLAISVPGTIGYLASGMGVSAVPWSLGFVSLPGFLAVASGTFFGAPFGASTAARLSEVILTRIFASYAALTGAMMIWESFKG